MKKIILFCMSLLPLIAMGETVTVEVSDTSRVVDLDEVVIVKDAFTLRRQPASSTVFGVAELQQPFMRDLRDVSQYVPSFVMPSYGSRYTSSMYVRGIGSRVNSPAVGLYVDNIPVLSKSMFNAHTYQLSRVDVMRGPQGTLYGQNTEGGLIRMYTKAPLHYQGTDVLLSGGTGFWRQAEVAHSRLLADNMGLSVAAFYDGQNGFFKNQTTGDRADKMNEWGAKARLQWRPAERWEMNVVADYQHVKQNGFPYGLMDTATATTQDPSSDLQGNYRRDMATVGLDVARHGNLFDLNYTASWQYLKDFMQMDIDYSPHNYMVMEQNQRQHGTTHELTLKSSHDGPWHWTLGAFGSAQWLKTDAPVHFEDDWDAFLGNTIQTAMIRSMMASADQAWRSIIRFYPTTPMSELPDLYKQLVQQTRLTTDMKSIPGLFRTPVYNVGLFHESNIDLTSRLTTILGLRYDLSIVEMEYETTARMVSTAVVPAFRSEATNDLTSIFANKLNDHYAQLLPKIGLRYRLDQQGSNAYAVVSKGYRAGGYNFQMFSDIFQTEIQNNSSKTGELVHTQQDYDNIAETVSYKPEESWNYELGSHLNLMDGKLQLDLAAYYMQIRNQQLSVMAGNYGFGRMMVNAGKSFSCGIEASMRGSLFDNRLTWSVNYGYTHAQFKEYVDSVEVGRANVAVDYKDKKVPFIPQHTVSATADYRFDMGQTGLRAIVLGANVTAQGKTYWDNDNLYAQKFYAVLGAHADADFGLLKLSLWGRNLTDTKFNTFVVDSHLPPGTVSYYANRGLPLQVGVDVRLHF